MIFPAALSEIPIKSAATILVFGVAVYIIFCILSGVGIKSPTLPVLLPASNWTCVASCAVPNADSVIAGVAVPVSIVAHTHALYCIFSHNVVSYTIVQLATPVRANLCAVVTFCNINVALVVLENVLVPEKVLFPEKVTQPLSVCIPAASLSNISLANAATYTNVPDHQSFWLPTTGTFVSELSNHLVSKVNVPAAAVPVHISKVVPSSVVNTRLSLVKVATVFQNLTLEIVTELPVLVSLLLNLKEYNDFIDYIF